MIIRYLSDIHLEFLKPNKISAFLHNIKGKEKEICVLAGDIGNPHHSNQHYDIFMKHISKEFHKTFVIPGNHEYYHMTKTMDDTNTHLENYFQQYDNISFLNNSYEIYENHCFIGTTLWSKITNPIYEINDVDNIPNFDYIKYNRLNRMCIDFLEHTMENNDNCIVITHHIPSSNLIDIKYKTPKMMPYNQWFYCDMEDTIKEHNKKIKCWIYGHTHTPSSEIIHDVPMLCNPIGYPNENSKIDFEKQYSLYYNT